MIDQPASVLPTHTPALFETAVKRAAELLRAGEVVALPTETVYGLAANALDPRAVRRIFEIKGRPAHNPIIVHVSSLAMARQCAEDWPPVADELARAFWPGPLTLVLPKATQIPPEITASGPTVGIRWPSHPLIQAVIRECRFPLAAPSANPSNSISPTNAEHVCKSLGNRIPLIVDGGQCQVGIESTVLDLSVSPPKVLRPGMIHEQSLQAVIGELDIGTGKGQGMLKSPGLLAKHYSPKAKVLILSWNDEEHLATLLARHQVRLARCHVISHTHVPSGMGLGRVSVIPHDAEAFGRAIYAELHECDNHDAEWIVIEALPESSEWQAIADRLNRAAG